MTTRQEIGRKQRKKVPIGNLREKVTFHKVKMVPGAGGKSTTNYVFVCDRFASIETRDLSASDELKINETNAAQASTHVFIFRYDKRIDASLIAIYGGQTFKINGLTDIDGRKEYTKARCRVLGSIEKEANEG